MHSLGHYQSEWGKSIILVIPSGIGEGWINSIKKEKEETNICTEAYYLMTA